MTKLDFYYWGDQCPHNYKMRQMLKIFLCDERCTINLIDIANDDGVAKDLNIFSPNMLVINDEIRWHGPISINTFASILNGVIPEAKPYIVNISKDIVKGEIKDLTEETVLDTCMLCASSQEKIYCARKGDWVKDIRQRFNLPHLGKLHYLNNTCIGGAEFVPSFVVPYPIPKADDIAFLTCSYSSSEAGDYKSHPLEALEGELPLLGFKTILAIVSENTPFPNGPLEWFLDRGYVDLGFQYYEERHFAKMHIIEKEL